MTADLRRMNARRDQDDRFTVVQRIPRRARGLEHAWVREARIHLPEVIEALEVLRARDRERDERRAEGRLAKLAVVDAVAGFGERFEVTHQDRPFDELAIIPGLEPEDRARRGDHRRRRAAGTSLLGVRRPCQQKP
jgi:hypothetical protein